MMGVDYQSRFAQVAEIERRCGDLPADAWQALKPNEGVTDTRAVKTVERQLALGSGYCCKRRLKARRLDVGEGYPADDLVDLGDRRIAHGRPTAEAYKKPLKG